VTPPKQTSALTFATETSPSEATIRAIESGLTAHATGIGLKTDWSPRWIIGRDEDEVVRAGIRFVLAFEWLFVNWLWVADSYREHGVGSQLMAGAEAAARAQGCRAAYLDTFTFQARSFTSGSVIGSSVDSMIFHPAMRAFGFRKRLAESRTGRR
jgi:GNAT superfamily N-acetyltransferase